MLGRLDHRAGGAAGHEAEAADREREPFRRGQPASEVGGQAVAGDNVITDPRHEHDPTAPCLGVAPGEALDHVDLAGDVEVVDTRTQARVDDR